jgi:hypothetical protein
MKKENHLQKLLLALAIFSILCFAFVGVVRAEKNTKKAPVIDPNNFQKVVANPYYPLVPGTIYKYIETNGKDTSEDEQTVMPDTKEIIGVTCTIVHDVVKVNGVVKEETFDWYAQDKQGTVWYFGEDTKEFKGEGKVSTEGSWQTGVDGAQPGIIMVSQPVPGKPYKQEYLKGKAEDMGQIIRVGDTMTVPYGTFVGCVKTKDWSMLEPGHEYKWYAKGIGVIREESTDGDKSVLISVIKP